MSPAVFWTQFSLTGTTLAIFAATGSMIAVATFLVITLRRQVQAAWAETGRIFQDSSARVDAVGDLMTAAYFETDDSQTLTFANRSFFQVSGYRRRDMHSGLNLATLIADNHQAPMMDDLHNLRQPDDVLVRDVDLVLHDDRHLPMSIRLSSIIDHNQVVGWRGLLEQRPEAEEDLSHLDDQVLGDILRDYNETAAEERDRAMDRSLARIGKHLGVERCYEYVQSRDRSRLLSIRQWYAPGVSPISDDEILPGFIQFPWTLSRLRDHGILKIENVADLPPAEVPERSRWLDQGITSILVVALTTGGEVTGFIGCETLGHAKHWGLRDRRLIEALAGLSRRAQLQDRTSRSLEEANNRAGNLAELMPEPLAMTDSEGQVVVWNKALEPLSGHDVESVRGQSAAKVIDGFLPGCGQWLQARDRSPDSPPSSNLFEIKGRVDETVWVQLTARSLAPRAGCLLHFCDVSVAKRAETKMRARTERLERAVASQQEELQMAQDRLVESEKNAAVTRMVTGLAHEINTPVGVGLTAASHLEDRARDLQIAYEDGLMRRSDFEGFLESSLESARLINGNLQRAADLVSGMRQATVDQVVGKSRIIPLKEYLEDVLLSLGPRLREKHAEVRVHCSKQLVMDADPGTLYRILSNLVMNSVHHAFDGTDRGIIDLSVERRDGHLVFLYRDNGRGMSPEQQSHIFEPFFTTARDRGGMGLGLHIVYSLVTRNLGGHIHCQSRPGEGTAFEISIPLPEDHSSHEEPR